MLVPFRHTNTTDRILSRIQDAADETLSSLMGAPLADSVLLPNVTLVVGTDNYVGHSLGRKPRGWLMTTPDGPAMVYTASTKNGLPDRQLILRTSATVTCSLVVF